MLKEKRLKLNLTQVVLAEKLGITERHLQRIENAQKKPSIDLLIKIINILDLQKEDIINYLKEIESL